MKQICIGDKYQIQCYKHNGKVHRAWDEAVVLAIEKDYIVFGNDRTQVIESSGNYWRTKEPAVMYFFKNKWFNIIAQMKKDGVYYYCNIASPFSIEENKLASPVTSAPSVQRIAVLLMNGKIIVII